MPPVEETPAEPAVAYPRWLPRVIRESLIFAGLAAGGALAVLGALDGRPGEPPEGTSAEPAAPCLLPALGGSQVASVDLRKPVSIETAFGRSLLTGTYVESVEADPIDALGIDGMWDPLNMDRSARADLPEKAAPDAVEDPQDLIPEGPDEADLETLSGSAAEIASRAETLLDEGLALEKSTSRDRADWNETMTRAAKLYEEARDLLQRALEDDPENPVLLDLMRVAKAALYGARKR